MRRLVLIHNFFSFFLAECPLDYPFAYLNGNHCCKTKQERPLDSGTPQNEIDDGSCDGFNFNQFSRCCKGDANTPCAYATRCHDNSNAAGKYNFQ